MGSQPVLNENDARQFVERNYRHNFIANVLDGTFFWFGLSFIASSTVLPLYVSHFTDSSFLIGLVAFINSFCVLAPQLFTSNWVARVPVKKVFPVTAGFFLERVPIFLMGPSVLLFAANQPAAALVAFFILYAWHCTGAGLIMVGWEDMLAKVIPLDRRGWFYGISNFLGTAAGILGAILVSWLLANRPFPQGYMLSFALGGVLILLAWIALAQTREPPMASSLPAVSQLEYFRSLPAILKKDPNFSRYLLSQVMISMGGMAAGFIIIYATRRWSLPDSQAGQYTIALLTGQALANLGFGWLADRKGLKLVLELSVLLLLACFALAALAADPAWFYLVFGLRGAAIGGLIMSTIMIAMEFSHPDLRPTYIGLSNTIIGITSGIAPLLAGWLAITLDYRWLFALSAGLSGIGYALLRWTVREPRHLPVAHPLEIHGRSLTE